ncbi:peptide transporter family 1-like isoform X2 [Lycorma delicatula]|uniref:peptide transporter family 1-like isoform X2 n=1 Tax=Lycorma delicatula TaxID=130591 RepID=UPI003F50E93F
MESSDEFNNKSETELHHVASNAVKNNERQIENNETEKEKEIKYPKAVFFIISNELCERFSYYGMRTILAIYLQKRLRYSENAATIIFHLFVMLCYFFPLVGAVIADSYLGRFRTIIYFSFVYAIGNIVLALSSVSVLQIPHSELTIIGLLLIATGTGGIKPCVSSFGGDQFIVPQQEMQLQQFFSIFYFSINIGSMLGTLISPILRQDVHCLGENTCFPIAFAFPAFLMISALVIFIAGKSLYKIKKPQGNVMVDVSRCVCYALKRRFFSKANNTKYNHWMDYAENKYDKKLIKDIKTIQSIAVTLLPTICFWALFEQQGSSWTFQATRMNGALWDGFDIKPDQVHIVNPILVLLLIPLFQKYLYPLATKFHILRTPLQKMSFGGIIAALAFFISGILELQLQSTYAVLPKPGEAQLRLYNGYNCSILLEAEDGIKNIIGPTDILELKSLKVTGKRDIQATIKININNCSHLPSDLMWTGSFSITENKAISYLIYDSNKNLTTRSTGYDDIEKSDYGKPKLRVIYNIPESQLSLINKHKEDNLYILLNTSDVTIPDEFLSPGKYGKKNKNYKLFTITPSNSIHIFWILPQYVAITLAEIFFSITGLEFTFMQAPNSMKSVTSSLWLLSISLGNLTVVFIAELLRSDSQAMQFFSYGGLMLVVMGVFILVAMQYKYVQIVTETKENNTHHGTNNEGFTQDSDKAICRPL